MASDSDEMSDRSSDQSGAGETSLMLMSGNAPDQQTKVAGQNQFTFQYDPERARLDVVR